MAPLGELQASGPRQVKYEEHLADDDPLKDKVRELRALARPEVPTFPAGDQILDEPEVDAKWGRGTHVLWSGGEPLFLVASSGLGKSTLAQQLALCRAGIWEPELLGYPVEVDAARVLYIAADRPRQLLRSWARMVTPSQRENLNRAILIANDVPAPLSSDPEALVPWVDRLGDIGTVIIDSLKDVASDLGSDSEGNAVNLALKNLIHSGREVVVLHHDRKADILAGDRKPREADIYGSRWLAAGAGSIIYLKGEAAGNSRIVAHHLKTPLTRVGPLHLRHDFGAGRTYIDEVEIGLP